MESMKCLSLAFDLMSTSSIGTRPLEQLFRRYLKEIRIPVRTPGHFSLFVVGQLCAGPQPFSVFVWYTLLLVAVDNHFLNGNPVSHSPFRHSLYLCVIVIVTVCGTSVDLPCQHLRSVIIASMPVAL